MKVVAKVVIIPIGEGSSISKYVKEAIEVLKKYNLKVEPTAMGTILEGDLDEILNAYKDAHLKVLSISNRVYSSLTIDHKKDVDNTIEGKLKSIGEIK